MPVKDMAKDAAWAAMQQARDDVMRLARELHDDPELAGQETRAVERLTGLLKQHGFSIETGLAGLPTAFRATRQRLDTEQMRKGLRHGHVAYLLEYDALPDVGHAEGHHLGAGAGLLAAIGLAGALVSELGVVSVIGCPAATARGGKVALTEAGVFEAPDVALGAHAAPPGEGYFYTIDTSGESLAEQRVRLEFADSDADVAKQFVAAAPRLRDNLSDGDDVQARLDGNGVLITLRGRDHGRIRHLRGQLRGQIHVLAGAPAMLLDAPVVDNMLVNRVLARRMKTCADNLGLRMDDIHRAEPTRVTDWGNVSCVVSSFEGLFPITSEPVAWGEPGFAAAANQDEAYEQMLRMGECLCFTGIDVLRDMNFRAVIDSQLVKGLKTRGIERPFRRWLGVHPVVSRDAMNGKSSDHADGDGGPKLESFRVVRGSEQPPNTSDES